MLKVQSICKEKGITLQDLAAELNITYQSLYESLKGNPTLKRLTDIANALGVDITELFDSPKNKSQTEHFKCPCCGAELQLVEKKKED